MNKIILLGNLFKDIEVKEAGNNTIARTGIAVRRSYKDAEGNYPTDFFNLTAFNNTAKFMNTYLKKGSKVLVEGSIRNNNYEKDGKTIYQDQIVVESIEFASSKAKEDTDGFNSVDEGDEDTLPFN